MKDRIKNIIAICIGILPSNIFMFWYRLTHTDAFTTSDMLVYPMIVGGGNILLILALNKYFLKREISDFNRGKSNWKNDILVGFILTIVYFLLIFFERATLMKLLPQGKPSSQ